MSGLMVRAVSPRNALEPLQDLSPETRIHYELLTSPQTTDTPGCVAVVVIGYHVSKTCHTTFTTFQDFGSGTVILGVFLTMWLFVTKPNQRIDRAQE